MSFVTTAIHATSLHNGENIVFREYECCETSKKYVKVMYISDFEVFINVFDSEMPKYLVAIYDYCKTSSHINYLEDEHLYVLMGSPMFRKTKKMDTLMVSNKNMIGEISQDVLTKETNNLQRDAAKLYKDIYNCMIQCKGGDDFI